MSWRPVKLGEVAAMKYGKLPPKGTADNEGFPIFTGYRIAGFCDEYLYDEPQVVVVARGVGGTGDVKMSPEKSWITNLSIVLSVDAARLDKRFLCYRLGQEPLRDKLNTGAAQAQITIENLQPYVITIPGITTQRRIVDILSAYDDLIENNRRRMALLEEAARHIYREWFVRLRFPGHEHTPITDGLPEGWERKPVEHLTEFLSRGIAPHYDEDADGLAINQKCIRGGRLDLSLARRQSRDFKPDRQVQHGDVLVNSTGEGTLGRVAQVFASIDNCTVDTHVTIVRPAPGIGLHYFGQALMEWEPRFSTMGRGATNQTELSRAQIGDVQILVPPGSFVQQFEDVAAPSFREVWVLMEQNERLRAARDLLLPRLMSGDLAV